LAEQKGKSRAGKQKYGRLCDSHRRKGHDLKAFRNPISKRYIPLNKCVMCTSEATDRHRVIPGSEYTIGNVMGLCKGCHRKTHLLYKELDAKGYFISQQFPYLFL